MWFCPWDHVKKHIFKWQCSCPGEQYAIKLGTVLVIKDIYIYNAHQLCRNSFHYKWSPFKMWKHKFAIVKNTSKMLLELVAKKCYYFWPCTRLIMISQIKIICRIHMETFLHPHNLLFWDDYKNVLKRKMFSVRCPDSKIHEANMGPAWVLSAPDGPHVGHMNLAIRVLIDISSYSPLILWSCAS